MILRVVLEGEIRSKKNSKRIVKNWRTGKPLLLSSAPYYAWEVACRWQFKAAYPGFRLLEGPVNVKALIYYRGPKPDLSGAQESIGDCMQGFIWKNDGQIVLWDGRLIHDKVNPRVQLEVEY